MIQLNWFNWIHLTEYIQLDWFNLIHWTTIADGARRSRWLTACRCRTRAAVRRCRRTRAVPSRVPSSSASGSATVPKKNPPPLPPLRPPPPSHRLPSHRRRPFRRLPRRPPPPRRRRPIPTRRCSSFRQLRLRRRQVTISLLFYSLRLFGFIICSLFYSFDYLVWNKNI